MARVEFECITVDCAATFIFAAKAKTELSLVAPEGWRIRSDPDSPNAVEFLCPEHAEGP